jgi:hypothetical protein
MTAPPFMQKRALERLLRPVAGPCCAHLDRAVALALAHGWHVTPAWDAHFAAQQATRTIYTRPLADDRDFAAFCHEGGHVEDPHVRRRIEDEPAGLIISIEGEASAWLWAMDAAAYRWNATMQTFMVACLREYVTYRETREDLRVLEAVVAHGADQAKHVVRLRPAPLARRLAQLMDPSRMAGRE